MREFLTAQDVAIKLGVSDAHVRKLLASGALAGRKHGSVWLVETASIDEFQRTRRPAGRPKGGSKNEPEIGRKGGAASR